MARFPLVTDVKGNPEIKALYDEIVASGFGQELPINWFTAQASRPDILKGTWALTQSILIGGQLAPSVKQMICMVASAQNNCRYCQVTHTRALESMGTPDEVVRSCAEDPELRELPAHQRALVKFAVAAARDANAITDKDFDELREHGFRSEEILEAAMLGAFTNFINTWADVSGIELDGGDASE